MSRPQKKRGIFRTTELKSASKPKKAVDNDLLAFVTGLEDMDVPEDTVEYGEVDIDEEVKETKKSKKKSKVEKRLNEAEADLDDFTAVLDDEDASFAGLKKKISVISGKADEEEEGGRKKRSAPAVVEAPLPAILQGQVDRAVAYEKTTQDISKWAPIVQKNRDADQLKFPLQPSVGSGNISSHTLVATFSAQTEMEKEIAGLMKRDGVNPVAKAGNETSNLNTDELPSRNLDVDQVQKELAKARSSKFFQDQKMKRQSKIKSKKYRKILAKERMRAEAEAIATGNLSELSRLGMLSSTAEDEEIRREKRMKAEMNRAKERLTLRTRKVNKWAQDLMNRRHGDAEGRLQILEQMKEKERLRQEIYGAKDQFSDEEDDDEESVSEEEFEEEIEDEEDDGEFEDEDEEDEDELFKSAEKPKVFTGRHKFGPSEEEAHVKVNDEDEEEEVDLESEVIGSIVKKTKGKKGSIAKEINIEQAVDEESEEEEDEDEGSDEEVDDGTLSSRWKKQRKLVKEAFAEDNVFAEFEAEKDATMAAEAPKTVDVTLPGWGSWSGPGANSEPKRRFVIHKDGLDPKARVDKNLKHVIINEKRIKAAATKYTLPKTPFPFPSADLHARHIAQPLGKEWNTVGTFQKQIKPRIQAKPGAIIDPIKFVKQAKHF